MGINSYDDPSTLTSHIQSEFEGRIKWEWNKVCYKHHNIHSASNSDPKHLFRNRWGNIVECDNTGKRVELKLPLDKQPEQ